MLRGESERGASASRDTAPGGRRDVCPSPTEVDAFVDGRLSPSAVHSFEAHIADCAGCRELVSAVCRAEIGSSFDRASSVAITLVEPAPSDAEPALFDAPLIAGTRIGRYTILERIGAGGMGAVHAARDHELDRKVAIKILRRDRGDASRRTSSEDQLIKEARAMAQLAHPNVVAVFEIGRFGDQVFLAMELVDGQTLDHWLSDQRPSWRKIVEVFAAAGHGLAAAHAAGLVHRDFKPANVLVGHDGRVRVTDFGVVQEATATAARRSVAGTPLYMAPEQFRGDPADPRTDQFNFCVALYRALYDQPPFPGDTMAELADAVVEGRLRPPPAGTGVPRWLGRVVVRGLATAPEARHGSMTELLRELQRAPQRWLRRSAAVASIAAAAMAASLLYQARSDPAPSCGDAARRVAAVWGPERRQLVERAFLATGKPFAPAGFAEVARTLDAYGKTWTEMRVDLCETARTAAGSANELAGVRSTCLDRRLSELRALVGAFADVSPEVVEHAPKAVHELADLAGCADARALLGPARLPSDPAARARIEALRDQLADAQAQRRLGRYRDAFERAQTLVPEVRATGYRPLEAETLLLVGNAAFDSGVFAQWEPALEAALFAAEAGGADEIAVHALVEMMYFHGVVTGHYEQAAREHAPRVNALLERLGGNDELAGKLHVVLCRLWRGANRYDKADEEGKLALALLERRFGPSDPRITSALFVQIWSAFYRSDWDTMLQLSQRMAAITSRVFGPDHPETAQADSLFGMALQHTERSAEARAVLVRTLASFERSQGPNHPALADILVKLGDHDLATGRFSEALGYFRRALEIVEKTTSTASRFRGQVNVMVVRALVAQQRDREALVAAHDAEPAVLTTMGEDSVSMSELRLAMGEALLDLGRYAEARDQTQTSLAILDRLFKPDHPWSARRHRIFGQIALETGRPEEALAAFERARALCDTHDGSLSLMLADVDAGIASALTALHRDPPRAHALAESARAAFASSPELKHRLQLLDDWLLRHPRAAAAR